MAEEAQSWPPVTVLLITWNRPLEVRRTLRSLAANLSYPVPLRLHIADDNSDAVCPGYLRDLTREAEGLWPGKVISSVTDRKGWGANANAGLSMAKGLVYQQEDDYVLTRPLDLRQGVFVLQTCPQVGMVRYRGILGHRAIARMEETPPGPWEIRQGQGSNRVGFWALERDSPELWLYSHGPHLKHPRFHKSYGKYPEGLPLGATEEQFAHTVKDGTYPQKIAVLPEWAIMWYDHIGKSRQHTADDPNQAKGGR